MTDVFFFTNNKDFKQCEAEYLEMKRLSKKGLIPKVGEFYTVGGIPRVSLKTKVDIDVWQYAIEPEQLLKIFRKYQKHGYLADVLKDKALVKTEKGAYQILDVNDLKKTNDQGEYKKYLCKIYDFYYERKHILDITGLFKKINLLPEEYKSYLLEKHLSSAGEKSK